MKKIVLLGLLVMSGFLVADGDPVEDRHGHLALYKNLSTEQAKRGYLAGRELGEKGNKLEANWRDNYSSIDYKDGFSLGYFHGKVIFLDTKSKK